MQLTIDMVPYEVEQPNEQTLIVHSDFYAEKLVVRSRFTEKYAGFIYYHEDETQQFVYVTADEGEGTITFESLTRPVTLDMIEAWWSGHFHAINEIGYETLERVPV